MTPIPTGQIEVRLWNGDAEVQVDGKTAQPGTLALPVGPHDVAALVDGESIRETSVNVEAGNHQIVDFVVPPPKPALAVIVENEEHARPQSGLDRADVVYEALAEGGISRFLAFYLTGDAPVVGPVRSLRHYFDFIAGDYLANLVHIGASPQGFAWRDAMLLGKLDESAGDPGVWRDPRRPAPHNAYTNTAVDRDLLAAMGRQRSRRWGPVRFSTSEPAPTGDPAEAVSIAFTPAVYDVTYRWDADAGQYLRSIGAVPHRDAQTGQQLGAATVIVQYANVQPIPGDPKLRLDMDLVGAKGRLQVFSGGTVREGSWFKVKPLDPMGWLDEQGKPLIIPPGPVWVEVVPLTARVDW